jgi:hypothetical protein
MGRLLAVLATLMICLGAVCASNPPESQPVATLGVSQLASNIQDTAGFLTQGTAVFLTDHTLAIGMCNKVGCNLATFDLSGGSPRQIGQVNGIDRYHAMFRSSDGGVLLGGVVRRGEWGAVLLDQSLQTSRWIPKVPGSSALGEKIADGQGRLLTHTTSLAAYWDHGTVRIQNVDGKLLGSFEVGGRSSPAISFLGQDRILFQQGGGQQIRDFNGKVLRRLTKPGRALGEKTKQSEDGSRLLYDSFTRRVGLAQTIKEDALVEPSMGMSADGYVPNGEVVRVIDTGSGRPCFEWYGKEKLLPPFGDHADVDPSGRLVAIMTQESLAIYRLPDACAVPQTDRR